MEADILIHECTVLTMVHGEIIGKGVIAVKNGLITYVGEERRAPPLKAEEVIEAQGKVAMPGLVNCHTHAPMSIMRGVAEDQELETWLRESIWPLEAKLTAEDIHNGALLSCLEMIKNGVTCFSDMYFREDIVAAAVEKSGLRAVLAPGIIEGGDPERGERMLEEAVRVVKKYHGHADGRIQTQIGPHAAYTCSPSLLKKVGETASSLNVGVHIHLAESRETVRLVRRMYGEGEVAVLRKTGLLGPNLLAAHGVYLTRREMLTLARYGVKISYNPVSNMKLASGIPRVKEMLEFGITVGVGTDGPASNNSLDVLETVKAASLLQKIRYMDPKVLPVREALEMATIGGARALGLSHMIGTLEPGKRADIILIDFRRPHLTPVLDVYANIVYSARGSDVNTVIVDGKILMRDRIVKTLDEEEVMRRAQKTAENLLSR